MRSFILATAALAATAIASPAFAQQHGNGGSHGGGMHGGGGMHTGGGQWHGGTSGGTWTGGGQQWHGGSWRGGGHRWGGKTGGHWSGGMHAPGGWAAYRRPHRGWRLPSYWIAPGFYINDWAGYGLSQPPYGYNWSRYYDDAVLVDQSGEVWDSRSGLDWDQYDDGYADQYDDDGGYDDGGYGADYPPPEDGRWDDRRGPRVRYARRGEVVQPLGPRIGYPNVVTSCAGPCGGVIARGYYYPAATTTTITVASAPAVTTTTTEYIEERAPVRVHYGKRKWHPKPKAHKYYTKSKPRCLCK